MPVLSLRSRCLPHNSWMQVLSGRTTINCSCFVLVTTTKAYLSVQLMLICAVVNWKCAVVIGNWCSCNCHRRSNYRGVSQFGAKFANLVHHAAVAPMPNVTRRSEEMHFEYKNVTASGGQVASPPWPLTRCSAPRPRWWIRPRLPLSPRSLWSSPNSTPHCRVLNFS